MLLTCSAGALWTNFDEISRGLEHKDVPWSKEEVVRKDVDGVPGFVCGF